MIKKTLSNGVKVLKISTWISAIFALIVVLIVGFFAAFPMMLKAPIEQQLSEISDLDVQLSKMSFDLDKKGISLKIHQADFYSENNNLVAGITDLYWHVNLMNLFDDIYHPSSVNINTLTLYSKKENKEQSISIDQLKQWLSVDTLDIAHFFESLSVQKTLVKGDRQLELAPLTLSRNKTQLLATIKQQKIDDQYLDIVMTLSAEQLNTDGFLTLPMVVKNNEFSLLSNIKIYQENGDDFVEFNGFVDSIDASDISDFLSPIIVGESTHNWAKRGFKSGALDDVHIHVKKNISKKSAAIVDFKAHLSNTSLLFNADWADLNELDADITTNGKHIEVMVNYTKLYDMPLENIRVQMADMSKDKLDVEVLGKIHTQSQDLIKFLRDAPLSSNVNTVLDQFSLSGKLNGDLNLIIPLDERESVLDIDLTLHNNELSTLDGAVEIKNYDSSLSFHDYKITSIGDGNIRNIPFKIRINPDKDRAENYDFAVELVNRESDFELYLSKHSADFWRGEITSKAFNSIVDISLNDSQVPTVVLNGLEVVKADKIKGNWNIEPSDIPDMNLVAKQVIVDGEKIPDFRVKLESKDNVLNIHQLEFDGIGVSDENLIFDGAWVAGKTRLIANAKGEKLSEFLEKLGIDEKVEGGQFSFDAYLFCDCTPWNMGIEQSSGIIKLTVKEGVFTDKDPSIGRILSLLNIKSIAKRLKLDVSDLTDKGFVYDTINAQITLQDALAKINHFQLNSTSSSISLSGESDIENEQYNLEAKVMPAVSDAVPAATYLAGGGLAGLGVWLADKTLFDGKLIDQIIDQVIEFKYKITGPWDEPVIENISSIL